MDKADLKAAKDATLEVLNNRGKEVLVILLNEFGARRLSDISTEQLPEFTRLAKARSMTIQRPSED